MKTVQSLIISCFLIANSQAFDFEEALLVHKDSRFSDFENRLSKPHYQNKLDFDPLSAKFYPDVAQRFSMSKAAVKQYQKHGFVSLERNKRYSFGASYYAIYTYDLPVLITTDSILHAMHKSFDLTLMDIEAFYFKPAIVRILEEMHNELLAMATDEKYKALLPELQDLDVYLMVARHLMNGTGTKFNDKQPIFSGGHDISWMIDSGMKSRNDTQEDLQAVFPGTDKAVSNILAAIKALGANTDIELFGEQRSIDFSQFQPRGHYTKSMDLKQYFRAMMWLGRSDCAFNLVKPERYPVKKMNDIRGSRNAIILSELVTRTNNDDTLNSITGLMSFLIGEPDSINLNRIKATLDELGITSLATIADDRVIARFQELIKSQDTTKQAIRSQSVNRDPKKPDHKAQVPIIGQMFGQSFLIDSYILSQVVYDAITFKGKPQMRMMPNGLDVMAALGNDMAGRLLKPEIQKYHYAANLMACEDYVNSLEASTWSNTLYNQWLDIIRELDTPETASPFLPQVMKTEAWRRKQLQTQLASWSQLRHDTILYAKQSYTITTACEYPTGYVEPYPVVYKKINALAERLAAVIQDSKAPPRFEQHIAFWKNFADRLTQLATLSDKELAAVPFTADEERFLKKTIDRRGGGSGPPRYDGWYAELFLSREDSFKWEPEIADVHTNLDDSYGGPECLQVGTGNVNFMITAIDNGNDLTTYVGPVFSYYEFSQPLTGSNTRLTDELWGDIIDSGKAPSRPEWIKAFHVENKKSHKKLQVGF